MKTLRLIFALVGSILIAGAAEKNALVWDAMEKTIEPRMGDGAADLIFKATNTSDHAVTIVQVRPSCGCTVVDLPDSPWVLAPGASGSLRATIDFSGKDGVLTKSLFVTSTEGAQTLLIHVKVPAMDEAARLTNQRAAQANRQAVFRGDCATCHATPTTAKTGAELFQAACAICHVSPHRASIVPDLLVARGHRDAAWWRTWIADGRDATLMPAFAQKHGGPLTEAQIESLIEFALSHLPTEAR